MAKKSPKNQPKQPSMANHSNISPHVDASTATIIPPDNTSESSPTHVAFREFIKLADLNSIKIFITTAASSSEGENLKLLWEYAFKEGLITGHQLYGKTGEVERSSCKRV
jgi:hypothetical protein